MRDLCLGVLVALLLSTLEVCGAPLPKVDKDTKLRLDISCYKWIRAQRHRKKRHKGKTSKGHKHHLQYRVLDALFGQHSAHNDAPVGSEININFHGVGAPLNAGHFPSHTITHGDNVKRGDRNI